MNAIGVSQTNNPTSSSPSSSGEAAIVSCGDDLPFQPLFTSPVLNCKLRQLTPEEENQNFLRFNTLPPFTNIRSQHSVGGFREGEINGKTFFIFFSSSQTEKPISSSSSSSGEAAIDSDGDDLLLQPLFMCPSLRQKAEMLKRKKTISSGVDILPINTYPHFPSIGSVDQEVQYLLDLDSSYRICKFPLVPLFWCNNKEPHHEVTCNSCYTPETGTGYYLCVTCKWYFHKECVESPLEIKHPSYPFLNLQLYTPPRPIHDLWKCICCEKCVYETVYYCPTYKLSLHPICAMKPIPLVLDHPKRHPHTLTFFPKQVCLPCDVCGLVKELIPTYICVRCVYVVHQDCLYFPHVIRISRHHHRISFTSSLPSRNWFCGVCRQKVENNCGAYSCNKCNDYFVHSRCALRKDVWDGKELDGVPEEPEIDVEPFERIAEGIIHHFLHGHNLKLEMSIVYDEDKFCQACILPIYEDNYYSCMDQCDFILHETCANAPRRKQHALHPHPLTLKIVANGYDYVGHFKCEACQHYSCGFVYENLIEDVGFRLDLRCASVSEPFEYQGHEHPLFLALTPEEEKSAICQICQVDGDRDNFRRKLNCIRCKYNICFRCATMPYKAKYKHDKHLLTFQKAKEAGDHSDWCDVCESKIVYSRKGGFYSCNDCCTSLHISCLLGKNPYMKAGQTVRYADKELHILRNNPLFRPFCHVCKKRCPHKTVYENKKRVVCSLACVPFFRG